VDFLILGGCVCGIAPCMLSHSNLSIILPLPDIY